MGFFSLLNDLTDPDKLTSALDKVEQTLSDTLDKAEDGLKSAADAVDRLDGTAKLAEEKIQVVEDTSARAIDAIKRPE